MLLCVNVSSWVASPSARPAISARTVSASTIRPLGDRLVVDEDGGLVQPDPGAVLDGAQAGSADAVDQDDARLGRAPRDPRLG